MQETRRPAQRGGAAPRESRTREDSVEALGAVAAQRRRGHGAFAGELEHPERPWQRRRGRCVSGPCAGRRRKQSQECDADQDHVREGGSPHDARFRPARPPSTAPKLGRLAERSVWLSEDCGELRTIRPSDRYPFRAPVYSLEAHLLSQMPVNVARMPLHRACDRRGVVCRPCPRAESQPDRRR